MSKSDYCVAASERSDGVSNNSNNDINIDGDEESGTYSFVTSAEMAPSSSRSLSTLIGGISVISLVLLSLLY